MNKKLFHNKYKTNSIRLFNWNYANPGHYFVTISTKNKINFFGKIHAGKMVLNDIGIIVANEWKKTQIIRTNIRLDTWIIMPNHLHGILEILKPVETHCNASLQIPIYKNKFGPQKNNLASIIRGFKGSTTSLIHKDGYLDFSWQSLYHEHIIQNDEVLDHIRQYILDNPKNWE